MWPPRARLAGPSHDFHLEHYINQLSHTVRLFQEPPLWNSWWHVMKIHAWYVMTCHDKTRGFIMKNIQISSNVTKGTLNPYCPLSYMSSWKIMIMNYYDVSWTPMRKSLRISWTIMKNHDRSWFAPLLLREAVIKAQNLLKASFY